MTRLLTSSEDVISYWFGDGDWTQVSYIQDRMGIWFAGKSESFNQTQLDNVELIDRLAEETRSGTLSDEWQTSRGIMARVLLFDQFPRCIYRGTADAFKYDPLSIELVHGVVNSGFFSSGKYVAIERFFMGVALQHSERIEDQSLGVQLSADIATDASLEMQQFFISLKGYPMEHHDVIHRFQRFPGRNMALGRQSTPEELNWMQSLECPQWAKSQILPGAMAPALT